MLIDYINTIQDIIQKNEKAWLITVVSTEGSTPGKPGIHMILKADGTFWGTIGGGNVEQRVKEKILTEKPIIPQKWAYDLSGMPVELVTDMICGGQQEMYVEPLFNALDLYIIGAGHCGMALSDMATTCGYRVTVIDDRPEWANQEKHPKAAEVLCIDYHQTDDYIPDDSFVVIMTHGHKHDGLILRQFLKRKLRYLGMIGSKIKVAATFEKCREEGYTEEEISRVYAPIGYPNGSQTPAEIAVSILAELTAVKYGKR